MFFNSEFWKTNIDVSVILLFVLLSVTMHFSGNQIMELNRNEKLSTLQIFGNITTILTLIFGFFLYGKTSLATLGIAVLCGIILFGTQFFNGGGFHPPQNWKLIVVVYTIIGIQSLAIVWMIGKMGTV
jgi:hypothetical protein